MYRKDVLELEIGTWKRDSALSACSLATRGAWIELLMAMHDAGRSGELRGTREQLAIYARCQTADIAQALTDLRATGAADVIERNNIVTVVSRKMSRDRKQREMAAIRKARQRSRECHGDVPKNGEHGAISDVCIQQEEVFSLKTEGDSSKKKFVVPTLEEVQKYCAEKGYEIDAEHFWSHYQANGWVQGKKEKPIRDWRYAIVTWVKNQKSGRFENGKSTPTAGQQFDPGRPLGAP